MRHVSYFLIVLALLSCSSLSPENAAAMGACINSKEPVSCLKGLEFLKAVESLHCDDAEDNDNDGTSDCEDDDCKDDALCKKKAEATPSTPPAPPPTRAPPTFPAPATYPTPTTTKISSEDCDNNKDDDGDGREDCADFDCDDEKVGDDDQRCEYLTETSCSDQFDNDNDGDEDCEDSDCEDEFDCIDNDGDTYTEADGDCNDANSAIHPAAVEVCNNIDDDCDKNIDDGLLSFYYLDSDGDHYGDPQTSQRACTLPNGYVTDGSDCDDSDTNVHPGQTEICNNGSDDDCNGSIDEGC